MRPAPPASAGIDLAVARRVLRIEAQAVLDLVDRVDERLSSAVEHLASCRGRVIVTGMGKSGIIARKIAATLSSTGTPAHFLHPAEAVHGDLGAVQPDDVVVPISQSGETPEVLRLVERIRRLGARIVALTGSPSSTLGRAADVTLDCGVSAEACPLNLAPTASTTAALAFGDALAMTLLVAKGFREEDFAHLHPGGQLGKRLLPVERLMRTGASLPCIDAGAPMSEVLRTMTEAGLGMTCVTAESGELAGVITDGDLRRRLAEPGDLLALTAADVMTRSPLTIAASALAVEALRLMEARRVTALIVVDDRLRIAGVVHLHDLWRTDLF
ncbi:MAG: KpsF/GutQ family sugar-phosphate isomerase [Acidobacteria bacterium]|nr:KpsF/GutQ family sugar-phosphate isomerase [Acidobacteriota bacterium]